MGVIHKTVHYLYPEEVCFLIEEGTAEVYIGEQSIDFDVYIQFIINYVELLSYIFDKTASRCVLCCIS